MKHITDLLNDYLTKLVGRGSDQLDLGERETERNTVSTHTETHDKFRICPRCSGFIPNNETPGAYPGALSRLDNKTEICSDCGGEEAVLDWQNRLTDWRKN